jgi:hypothetical protein
MSEDALDRKAVERFAGNVTRGLLKAVPEADLFAMLSEPEYDGLKRSILDAGKINVPIHITPDGVIVDGRNRAKVLHDLGMSRMHATEMAEHYEAICTMAKARITVDFVVVAEADIASIVMRLNILRRHLSPEERARLVLSLTSKPGRRAKGSGGPLTVKQAATLAQVSERTIKRARQEANQGPQAASEAGVPQRSRKEREAEMYQRLLLSAERNMPLLGASRAEARAAAVRLVKALGEE